MRKTLSLVLLGSALAIVLACSGESSTPTAPSLAASPELEATFDAVSAGKQWLCHRNNSEEVYGIVVEVSAGDKTHKKHLNNGLDCSLTWCGPFPSGVPCDPTDDVLPGANNCDSCPIL